MKKISTMIAGALIAVAPSMHAQLSSRTGSEGQFMLGTRPAEGTKMLTFNFDVPSGAPEDTGSGANLYSRLGLTNGRFFKAKYFWRSDVALRGAINISRSGASSKGDIDTSGQGGGGGGLISNNFRSVDRSFLLVPGIEYHFAYTNLFDIYAGGDVILGRGVSVMRNDQDFTNDAYNRMESKTPYTALGLNPFVGVNVFIANMPVSLGLEYGITAAWKLGGRTKVTSETKTPGGAEVSREYYTQDTDALGNPDANEYSSLSRSRSTISTVNNFRITLNLYFD
jgi:hypothetical protein